MWQIKLQNLLLCFYWKSYQGNLHQCLSPAFKIIWLSNLQHCLHCWLQEVQWPIYWSDKKTLEDRFKQHLGYVANNINATGTHFNSPGHSRSDMTISVLEKVSRIDRNLRETRESTFIEMFNLTYRGMNKKRWLPDNLQSANKKNFLNKTACFKHEPINSNFLLLLIYDNLYALLVSLSDEDLLKIEINYSLSLRFYV